MREYRPIALPAGEGSNRPLLGPTAVGTVPNSPGTYRPSFALKNRSNRAVPPGPPVSSLRVCGTGGRWTGLVERAYPDLLHLYCWLAFSTTSSNVSINDFPSPSVIQSQNATDNRNPYIVVR